MQWVYRCHPLLGRVLQNRRLKRHHLVRHHSPHLEHHRSWDVLNRSLLAVVSATSEVPMAQDEVGTEEFSREHLAAGY